MIKCIKDFQLRRQFFALPISFVQKKLSPSSPIPLTLSFTKHVNFDDHKNEVIFKKEKYLPPPPPPPHPQSPIIYSIKFSKNLFVIIYTLIQFASFPDPDALLLQDGKTQLNCSWKKRKFNFLDT